MDITSFLNSKDGRLFVSIVLGFGLATLFRKVCKGNSCIVVKGPKPSEVQKHYYKIEDKCYKYTPKVTPCDDSANVLEAFSA
jgi:hypothetical protein